MFQSLAAYARPLLAVATLASIISALPTSVSAATRAGVSVTAPADISAQRNNYTFVTLDDRADPSFNQLLGINNDGKIVGYFGSGLAGHPNVGYRLQPPYAQGNYTIANFPGAIQTQDVAVNNIGESAGFFVDANGNNFGWIHLHGKFVAYRDPKTGTGTVNQILGLNDRDVAVGFYTDGNGMNHGFALNAQTNQFFKIKPPCTMVMATGINNSNDVTGSCTAANGNTIGFLLKNNVYYTFSFPGSPATTPFGINNNDEIVGSYVDAAKNTHGFTLKSPLNGPHFHSIDDPNGIGTTVINGVNDHGDLVGFYVDIAGNTDGMLARKI